MTMILKSLIATFITLFLSLSAYAGPKGYQLKVEEVKKFSEALKSVGILDVKFEGIDALAQVRPELKSSLNEIAGRLSKEPAFFKENKVPVEQLVTTINAASKGTAAVLRKANSNTIELSEQAQQVVQAVEALPGSLATIVTGKNGDIARLQRVATILSKGSETVLTTRSVESDILAGKPRGTEQKPETVDDMIMFVEKAMNENRTDGKKFSLRDLIEACLAAGRKGGI